MKTAIIRADAAPNIGNGHVVRCLALAEALADLDFEITFVSSAATIRSVPELAQADCDIIVLEEHLQSTTEAEAIVRRFPQGVDLLVVDHYGRDSEFENACRPVTRKIAVLDDLADRRHECDVLLDAGVDRRREDYADLLSESCYTYFGPAYAPVRSEFRHLRSQALERRRAEPVRRMLISFGGTDAKNMTTLAICAAKESRINVPIDVVIGAGASNQPEVEDAAAKVNAQIHQNLDAAEMADIIGNADMAIGAAGTTTWERCCLGLPSLLVVTADNQEATAKALDRERAAKIVGRYSEVTEASLTDAISVMAEDVAGRQRMAAAGMRICDGLGSHRMASVMDPPLAADGELVTLRPATKSDLDITFAWQCDPQIRRYFRNSPPPGKAEHETWFEHQLADPLSIISIIVHGTQPAGVFRLDPPGPPHDLPAYDVSILVAPDHQRLGISVAALALARQLVPEAELSAEVLPGNTASHAMMISAGYHLRDGQYVDPPIKRAVSGCASIEAVKV